MEQVLRLRWPDLDDVEQTASHPRVASDWPLMSDILTHRAGWPEHLIRWRRAEGEDEPGRG